MEKRLFNLSTMDSYWNNGDFDDSSLPEDFYAQAAEYGASEIEKNFPDVEVVVVNGLQNNGYDVDDVKDFSDSNFTIWMNAIESR